MDSEPPGLHDGASSRSEKLSDYNKCFSTESDDTERYRVTGDHVSSLQTNTMNFGFYVSILPA